MQIFTSSVQEKNFWSVMQAYFCMRTCYRCCHKATAGTVRFYLEQCNQSREIAVKNNFKRRKAAMAGFERTIGVSHHERCSSHMPLKCDTLRAQLLPEVITSKTVTTILKLASNNGFLFKITNFSGFVITIHQDAAEVTTPRDIFK